MIPLQIPRRNRKCSACENPFQSNDLYHSILNEQDEGKLAREDLCPSCWEEKHPEHKSHWCSKVPEREIVDLTPQGHDERLMELLKECVNSQEENDHRKAFVVALYLTRRKKLIQRQEIEHQGHDVIIYEVKENEEMLSVPKVSITTLQVAEIQKSFAHEQPAE